MKFLLIAQMITLGLSAPHLHSPYYNPYYVSYAPQIPTYSSVVPTLSEDASLSAYLSTPEILPTLNVLAEVPYAITNSFTVVPMLVMAEDNMKLLTNAEIMKVSKKRPTMTIRTEENHLVQCTPAVKIVLERPITVFSLKTSVLFPAEIEIVHQGYRIPIRVGAIIAPVHQDTYISVETPIAVNVVYAVPTAPVRMESDVVQVGDGVVVEAGALLPPKNVTIIDFPDREAEPVLQVDEADDELVNRNPPILLAPAGIVQSTQPFTHVEQFTNSKESPVLIALRVEAQKRV